MFKTFTAKIGNMRKPQRFVVYPRKSPTDEYIFQSDKCIGSYNPVTKAGKFNNKGCYFHHLNTMLGAKNVEWDASFIKVLEMTESKEGDSMGGVVIAVQLPETKYVAGKTITEVNGTEKL